jgi:hypothetical protein
MKRIVKLCTAGALAAAVILAAGSVPAQAPRSLDDILSVVQGGTKEVAQPKQVKDKGGCVEAASAQDAINAGVRKLAKQAGARRTAGCTMVRFPSGLGYVAMGLATYGEFENPTATSIARRNAYIAAYTAAKKELATTLGGLTSEGKVEVRAAMLNVNLSKEEMTSLKQEGEEPLRQAVEMLLRGFEIYEVEDNAKARTVYVAIVSTPKTRQRMARLAPHAVGAADLASGIKTVLAELRAGVVPPVGGRIVQLPNGETALVGYGSAIVRKSENATLKVKLELAAQKVATMRAADSLVGLLAGDQTSWRGEVIAKHRHEVKEFEAAKGDDGIPADAAGLKKLAKARESFVSLLETKDEHRSVREGRLPPGTLEKGWLDEHNEWAFSIRIYSPSLEWLGRTAAQEITDPPMEKRPGKSRPGPSGKVGSDKDR